MKRGRPRLGEGRMCLRRGPQKRGIRSPADRRETEFGLGAWRMGPPGSECLNPAEAAIYKEGEEGGSRPGGGSQRRKGWRRKRRSGRAFWSGAELEPRNGGLVFKGQVRRVSMDKVPAESPRSHGGAVRGAEVSYLGLRQSG